MNIFLVEPYYGGSHKNWVDSLVKYSKYNFKIFSLPARHWKWRMEGGAIELAKQVNASTIRPDLFLVTDFLNVSLFKSLLKKGYNSIPILLYFHENQFAYPFSQDEKHSDAKTHFSFINYTSSLVSDVIIFNSDYNKSTFYQGAVDLLNKLPDFKSLDSLSLIKQKSKIIPVGITCNSTDEDGSNPSSEIVILWNHRWEYDKNPRSFLKVIQSFDKIGFKLNICGEQGRTWPQEFDAIKMEFKNKIKHFGYVESKNKYYKILGESDFLPVTSNQEFFGISVLEAAAMGVIPILPKRLSYIGLFQKFPELFYEDESDIQEMILDLLPCKNETSRLLINEFSRYQWSNIILEYDNIFRESYHEITQSEA